LDRRDGYYFLYFFTIGVIIYLLFLYKIGIRSPFETYEFIELLVPLISSISASIFILLISFIMVAIQLNGKFASLTTKYFFDRRVTIYLSLLLSNVFIPILILPFPFTLLVHIMFIYTFMIILALIPFFSLIRDRLKIDFILECIEKEIISDHLYQIRDKDIKDKINIMNPKEVFILVEDLKNIIIHLCETKNYTLIKESLSVYGELTEKIIKSCDIFIKELSRVKKERKKDNRDYHKYYDICVDFIDYQKKCERALEEDISQLGDIYNKKESNVFDYCRQLIIDECKELLKFYSESGEEFRFIFEIYSGNLKRLICKLVDYERNKKPEIFSDEYPKKKRIIKLYETYFMSCCERLQNLCWKSQEKGNTENVFVGLTSFKEASLNYKKNKTIFSGLVSWIIIIGAYACYKKKQKRKVIDYQNIANQSIDIVYNFLKIDEGEIDIKQFEIMMDIARYTLEKRKNVWIQKPNSLNLWKKEYEKKYKIK